MNPVSADSIPAFYLNAPRISSAEEQILDFRALALAASMLQSVEIETLLDSLRAMDDFTATEQISVALMESMAESQDLPRNDKPLVSMSDSTSSAPASGSDSDSATCSICLEPMNWEEGSDVVALDGCNHRFHSKCISEWFHYASRCPLCQTDLNSNLNSNLKSKNHTDHTK